MRGGGEERIGHGLWLPGSVLTGGGGGGAAADRVHPPLAQAHEREQAEHRGAGSRERAAALQVAARELRVRGQAVDLGLVHQEIEGVQSAQRPVGVVTVEPGVDALRLELLDALLGPSAQLDDRPELDRVGRARLGARRLEPDAHAVVAERAFLRRARHGVHVDDAERAGGDTGPAAVAHVRLDDDRVELGADDGAGRAHLEATGLDAVLADVAHHQPAAVVGPLELLDELYVAPVGTVEPPRVVVAVPTHLRHPAVLGGKLVPVLARDLARLAPDADRGVGEESHGFGHGQALSTLQTNAFPSWIDTLGSPTHAVRSLTTSPTASPAQPQCHGMPTWWMRFPPTVITPMRSVTSAFARMRLRGVLMCTQSRFLMPFSSASALPISMNSKAPAEEKGIKNLDWVHISTPRS